MSDLLIKIIIFLFCGGIGFAVDLFIATQLIKTNTMKLVYANSIGFVVGICIKFFLVKRFAFNNSDPQVLVQFIEFFIIGLIGLLVVNYIVFFLHVKKSKKFFISKVLSMMVFMVGNFTANYFITFAK
jgi:putative flippase GtrA